MVIGETSRIYQQSNLGGHVKGIECRGGGGGGGDSGLNKYPLRTPEIQGRSTSFWGKKGGSEL